MPPPRLKRSNTAGQTPASLEDGEIAINQADGKLYYRTADGGVDNFAALPATDSTMTGVLTVKPVVGPAAPDGSVQVIGDNTNAAVTIQRNADSAGNPALRFKRTRGSTASPTIVQTNDTLGAIAWHSVTTTGAAAAAGLIRSVCTQTPSAGDAALRTQLEMYVCDGSVQGLAFTITPTASNFSNSLTVGGTAVVVSSDSRLSDARTPTSHAHGNITNGGAIGSTSGLPVLTGASGVLTTGAFGTTSGSFCQGNDARLSDARTPTAHTHAATDIVSGTLADSRLSANVVLTSDSRLSDARTPTAHTQAASTITDFATEAAKYGPVTSVNGLTGAVTINSSNSSGGPTLGTIFALS